MTFDRNPFASRTLSGHLGRGLVAATLVFVAIRLLSVPDLWRVVIAVPNLVVAAILMRGCPICWLIGLMGTIATLFRKVIHHD